MLQAEGEMKRFVIDQDLDQPAMAAKENKAKMKQQILEYPSGH
jgi:hypothetical protein